MGLDRNGIRFLCYASRQGVDFARTLCIGRQWLFAEPAHLSGALNRFGFDGSPEAVNVIYGGANRYAEPFLEILGARGSRSLDFSDYEGATDRHDLNLPVSDELKGLFSAVIDGGSLEHVFNLPVALKNCMEMVEPGGHLLLITPANNHMGHGFYQFSPELFFTALSEPNGFQVEDMFAFEDGPCDEWYRVISPKKANTRVWSINQRPTYLLVMAKRTRVCSIFETPPQQSDYQTGWSGGELAPIEVPLTKMRKLRSAIGQFVPEAIKVRLRNRLYRPGFDPRFFTRFDPTE